MFELSGQILDMMVILMLAVVGALVLWLHYRLHQLRSSEKKMMLLGDDLSEILQKAKRGLFEFSRLVREEGPRLEKEVFTAGQTVQDLDFMLAKAERLLKRMDDSFERSEVITGRVDGQLKSDEKTTLLGGKTPQKMVQPVRAQVSKTPQTTIKRDVPAPKVLNKARELSEAEIEKKLERELLTGLVSELPEKNDVSEEVQPRRMTSPQMGAMAYGSSTASAVSSTDAERDLIKALEGRL
jgi:hypothetical protein